MYKHWGLQCLCVFEDLCRKTQASKLREKPRLGKNPELHRPANYTDQRACAHTPLPRDKRKTQQTTPHPSQNQPKTQSTNPRKNPSKGKPKEDPARTPGREEGEQLEQLRAAGKVAALEGSATNVGRIPFIPWESSSHLPAIHPRWQDSSLHSHKEPGGRSGWIGINLEVGSRNPNHPPKRCTSSSIACHLPPL